MNRGPRRVLIPLDELQRAMAPVYSVVRRKQDGSGSVGSVEGVGRSILSEGEIC